MIYVILLGRLPAFVAGALLGGWLLGWVYVEAWWWFLARSSVAARASA